MRLLPCALVLSLIVIQPPAFHAQFDHLVVAIRSLDEGVAAFETLTGVRPAVGGRHPDRGTENALVSLGDGMYLEVIAPQKDATLRPEDEMMRGLSRLTIIDWAVSVSDMGELRDRLGTIDVTLMAPQPGSRITPSGQKLEWSTAVATNPRIETAPFFIRWSPATTHPSTTSPGGCSLAALTVTDPQASALGRILQSLGVTRVATAPGESVIEATLACGSRRVRLSSKLAR